MLVAARRVLGCRFDEGIVRVIALVAALLWWLEGRRQVNAPFSHCLCYSVLDDCKTRPQLYSTESTLMTIPINTIEEK